MNSLEKIQNIILETRAMQTALSRGVLPSLKIFNQFTTAGVDDTNERDCVSVAACAQLNWPPFKITQKEYDKLIEELELEGHHITIDDLGATNYSDWFSCLTA